MRNAEHKVAENRHEKSRPSSASQAQGNTNANALICRSATQINLATTIRSHQLFTITPPSSQRHAKSKSMLSSPTKKSVNFASFRIFCKFSVRTCKDRGLWLWLTSSTVSSFDGMPLLSTNFLRTSFFEHTCPYSMFARKSPKASRTSFPTSSPSS